MDEKPQRGAGTRMNGNKGSERDHGVRDTGSVGSDVPDQSKERNTEIADIRSPVSAAATSASGSILD
jgi:hypothetical protein